MSEVKWVDATNNPQRFAEAVKNNDVVSASFDGDQSLEWTSVDYLMFSWKGRDGEYQYSSFPGLFKRDDLKQVFRFYDLVKEALNG